MLLGTLRLELTGYEAIARHSVRVRCEPRGKKLNWPLALLACPLTL